MKTFRPYDPEQLLLLPPAIQDRLPEVWVADITYIPTWSGFLFLAVVLDVWSRRIVGCSMAEYLRTELVLAALNMALWRRRPAGVIHHSDQGSQYTAIAFGSRCAEAGVRPSMGSVGDCFSSRARGLLSTRHSSACSRYFRTVLRLTPSSLTTDRALRPSASTL